MQPSEQMQTTCVHTHIHLCVYNVIRKHLAFLIFVLIFHDLISYRIVISTGHNTILALENPSTTLNMLQISQI